MAWVTTEDVLGALGHAPSSPTDEAWLELTTAAANDWCQLRRKHSGYVDDPATPPSEAVKLGTVLYAAACYKERGAVESFASFDGFAVVQASGNLGQIKRLLGVDRPAVA